MVKSFVLALSLLLLALSIALLVAGGLWVLLSGPTSRAHSGTGIGSGEIRVPISSGGETRLASYGGEVEVRLEQPPEVHGAVLTYKQMSPFEVPRLPLGVVPTAKAFELSMSVDDQPVLETGGRTKPVILTARLSPREISLARSDSWRLIFLRIGEAQDLWQPLNTDVNPDEGTAQASSRHLGTFVLAMEPQEQRREAGPSFPSVDHMPGAGGPATRPATPTVNNRASGWNPWSEPRPGQAESPQSSLVPTKTPQPAITPTPHPTIVPAPTPAPSPTPTPVPLSTPTLIPTATPVTLPTPVPVKEWDLQDVSVRGDVVRAFVRNPGSTTVLVSLEGAQTPETYLSPPVLEHVFRGLTPGEYRLKAWTPGVPSHVESTAVYVLSPTPTPVPTPTPDPGPRHRLLINGEPVPPRHTLVDVEHAVVSLSAPPWYDGKYDAGKQVSIVANPEPGYMVTWAGIDSQTGSYGTVAMVADRYVSIGVALPTPTPNPMSTKAPDGTPQAQPTKTKTPTLTPKPTRTPKLRKSPTPTSSPHPTPVPTPLPIPVSVNRWGETVIESDKDGDFEIYVVSSHGSRWTQVTDNDFDDRRPAWSPAGTRIAFDSDRSGGWEIWTVNRDGTGEARITYNPARDTSPAWSQNGKEIVFQSDRNGKLETFVMCADGSNPRRAHVQLSHDPCSS